MVKTKEHLVMKLEDIKPYAKNEKIHTQDNLDIIRASLVEIGYVTNITVDENNEILAGHGRLIVLKEDGFKEIEVTKITGLSEVEKNKYRLYDNQSARTGKYNTELLIDTVSDILEADPDFSITKLQIEGLAESFSEDVLLMDFGKVETEKVTVKKDVVIIPTEDKEEIMKLLDEKEIKYFIGYETVRL